MRTSPDLFDEGWMNSSFEVPKKRAGMKPALDFDDVAMSLPFFSGGLFS